MIARPVAAPTFGGDTPLPPELRRWNWGAFLLNWLWAIVHKSPAGLLVFVPFFGLVMPFVLGAKGNAWAWRNGRWQSVEQFQQAQRRWLQYALIAYPALVGLFALIFFVSTALMKHSMAFELAQNQLNRDLRVAQLLGSPIELGMVQGSIATNLGDGTAEIRFPVEGPTARGEAYVSATAHGGRWTLTYLELALESGMRMPMIGTLREPENSLKTAFKAAIEPIAQVKKVAKVGTLDKPSTATTTTQAPATQAPASSSAWAQNQGWAAPPTTAPMHPVTVKRARSSVHGSLPPKAIGAAIDQQLGSLAGCFSQIAPGTLRHTQNVRLQILPSGTVQNATLAQADAVDPLITTCIEAQARQWSFPKSKGIVIVDQAFSVTQS
ncbi:MAG: hypothetical protein RL701_2952 [Pseudomonadota bacterium]